MAIKLTSQSFLNGLQQSGLIEPARWDALLEELAENEVDLEDSSAIAHALVARGIVTPWQSEQLLQGRHKGFLLGRYRLLSLLGTGEMSAVFLARHMVMDRLSAIKVLPGNRVKDTSYLGRFYREAKAVAALDHPNIIRAYDVDRQEGGGAEIHFLVMEYVAGKTLEKLVVDQGPLDFIAAADLIRQAADGLQHAHMAGLVHRDVKPGNLLIDDQGTLKLLDLGLARFFKSTEEESLTLKHDERVLGTADYLAPEQAIDSHTVDARADIYSLGCAFYYALTGKPPYTEGTLVQRLMAHQTKPIPDVRDGRADVPETLQAILTKMMAKKADDRYQTAADVSDALLQWLAHHGGENWKRRNRELLGSLTTTSAAVASNRSSDSDNNVAATIAATGTSTQFAAKTTRVPGRPAVPEATATKTAAVVMPPLSPPLAAEELPAADPTDRRLKIALLVALAVIAVVTAIAVAQLNWPTP